MDDAPAVIVTVARTTLEDVVADAEALARLLDDAGAHSWAEALRHSVVAPLAGELALAED
jgi:hypothetical protein